MENNLKTISDVIDIDRRLHVTFVDGFIFTTNELE
jgi:hypothetical protein